MESNTFVNKSYVQLLLALVLVGVVAALAAYTYATLESDTSQYGPATISVTGEGEVLAVPDIGQFTFSVRAEGADANEAQQKSAESINAIISYLTDNGVAEKDIKTQNYNLNPKYRYEERVCVSGSFCPPGNPVLDGFEVSQSVAVKVRDIDNSGALISGVGERGATNISSLQFTIDDEDALQAEARAVAIADAKAKAKVLAKDLGVELDSIMGYWEDNGGFDGEMYARSEVMSFNSAMGGAPSPALPTGENKIVSRVNVTYMIKD